MLVARGAGYTREIKLYNMRGELLDSNVYSNTNVDIVSATSADTKLCVE